MFAIFLLYFLTSRQLEVQLRKLLTMEGQQTFHPPDRHPEPGRNSPHNGNPSLAALGKQRQFGLPNEPQKFTRCSLLTSFL